MLSPAAITWAAGSYRPSGQFRRDDGRRRPAARGRWLGDAPSAPVRPYESADPDTARIWWSDTGVHQNLTFSVHPDPISGMHCWHQAVRVRPADRRRGRGHLRGHRPRGRGVPGVDGRDPAGGLRVARRPARPGWLMRPLKPSADAFTLPGRPQRRTIGRSAGSCCGPSAHSPPARRGPPRRRRPRAARLTAAEYTGLFVLTAAYASIHLGRRQAGRRGRRPDRGCAAGPGRHTAH